MDWQQALAQLIAICRGLGKLTVAFVIVIICLTASHIAVLLYQFLVAFLKQVLFGQGG